MGNIFCGCLMDDDISKLDNEIRNLLDKKKNQKFGICDFCHKSRACYYNLSETMYNGSKGLMICLDCDKELNKEVLYIY